MSEDAASQGEGLRSDERDTIVDVCARHDFPIREVQLDDEILKLTPRSLEDLPDGQQLEAIASELEDDFRYVTFAVPDADSAEEPT